MTDYKIDRLKEQYNGDHDVGVDFNWVDMKLLDLIEDLFHEIQKLQKEILGIRNGKKEDNGIIGKLFFIESPSFEGFATVLSVSDDDTVNVKSDFSGEIYIVEKDCLKGEGEKENFFDAVREDETMPEDQKKRWLNLEDGEGET